MLIVSILPLTLFAQSDFVITPSGDSIRGIILVHPTKFTHLQLYPEGERIKITIPAANISRFSSRGRIYETLPAAYHGK